MRVRAMIGATVVGTALMALSGAGAASAQAATTCTWGGTPAEPTGTFVISPGLTNTPAAAPLAFKATGPSAGGCSGRITFTGQMNAGSTCLAITWQGKVKGLPGVARFAGGGSLLGPSLLYDSHGNVVGSETATVQMLPGDSEPLDCNTPEGFTHAHFSSVIELF
jgi:hypothetical protein